MINGNEICEKALKYLIEAGGDSVQCKVVTGVVDELNVDAGDFSLLRSVFNNSVSMKVIVDNKKGTISVNNIDDDSLRQAAALCVQNAKSSAKDECESISPLEENCDFVSGELVCDKDKFFDRINEYMDTLKSEFPEILVEQLIASYGKTKSFFANTNGVRFTNESGYYSISSMYSAYDGERTTSFNETGADCKNLDRPLMDLGMQREMYRMCVRELDSSPMDKGFVGKIVVSPSCLGDIVCEGIDSFTCDSSIIDGTSVWKDKLGQKVASDKLTVSLIPLDERTIGGERYTPEGYKTKNCTLIENGVLKSFTLSAYAAKKTGNDRCSTMSGCYEIGGGDKSLDEIFADIDIGLYVCRLSGGEPAGNGDFSATAKNSFLIENGKITRAVSEPMISGNLEKMMNDIVDVSSERVEDGTNVFPWICFDGVTVS